jgi:diacylglycerol kinase family enzyme
MYVGLCFEAAAFPEDLTAELSTTLVACGDDFRVSGVSRNADSVNILVIPPRGSDGTQIATGSVNSDKPSENIYHKTASVSKINREFAKEITVDKDADTGKYLVVVLSPGKDGRYGATDADPSGIFSKLVKDYGLDVTAMTQEKLVAIIQDATVDAVGSDDLIWLEYVKVEILPPPSSFGSISISSNPSGADIYLNGEYQGTTPKTISDVPLGDHKIELKKSGYEDWSDSVYVKADEIESVSVKFKPETEIQETGTISITSEPSSANIYLDGEYQGTTPKTISDVPPGDHKIELKKSGYEDWSASVSVKADETESVSAGLKPETEIQETGTISITSEPSGAEIYLDGEYQGTTPMTISDVILGDHKIELKKSGYEDWSASVSVKATTPMTISDVISGDHKIKLKKSGYEDWSYSVSVKADEIEYVSAELISPPLDSFYPIIFFVCTVAIVLFFIIYRRKKAPSGKTTLTKLPKSENEYRAKMEEWEKEGYDVSELKDVLEGKK